MSISGMSDSSDAEFEADLLRAKSSVKKSGIKQRLYVDHEQKCGFSLPHHFPRNKTTTEVSNLRNVENIECDIASPHGYYQPLKQRLKYSTYSSDGEEEVKNSAAKNSTNKLHDGKQTSVLDTVTNSFERLHLTPKKKLQFVLSSSDSEDAIFSQKVTPRSNKLRTPYRMKINSRQQNVPSHSRRNEVQDVLIINICSSDEDEKCTSSNANKYNDVTTCFKKYRESLNLKELTKDDTNLFLASLSAKQNTGSLKHVVEVYTLHYARHKQDLAKNLFFLFNKYVFGSKLPDEISITWKSRLTSTAGYCKCSSAPIRNCLIELSSKLLNTPDKLRDTLIHELCHAAVFLITKESDSHGSFWQYWTTRANLIFSSLPPITRCHSYK